MTFPSFLSRRPVSLPETHHDVTKPLSARALFWGRVLISIGTFGYLGPHAQADTLPNLDASCFTYMPGHTQAAPHVFSSSDFRAELPGTGLKIRVASTRMTDHAQHLDTAGLERINAAAAYATLSALHHGLSDACRSMPLPETDEIKGSKPEAHWTMVTLSQPGKTDITVKTVHISILSTSPGIHTVFDAVGLPTDHPLLPSRMSGDVTFYPATTPPYHIDLHSIKSVIGESDIEGHGTIEATPTIHDLKGDLHLSISHIGALIEKVGSVAPATTTAALSVARIMSIHEGPHISGWKIHINNGEATVNGISLPLPKK